MKILVVQGQRGLLFTDEKKAEALKDNLEFNPTDIR